jgi:hypothetical protein
MKSLILTSFLLFPIVSWANCENKLSFFVTSVDLFTKVSKLHDLNKKLFKLDRLSKQELELSQSRLVKGADLVVRSQRLYKQCQNKDMV